MIRTACALAIAAAAMPAIAQEVIFETAEPFGSPFGVIGFDVFVQQSVAVRFTPDRDYRLTSVSAWFMSNNFDTPLDRPVRLTIQTDRPVGDSFVPSGEEVEVMELVISAIGWDPQLDTATASGDTILNAGQAYWVVAESDFPAEVNPVWNWATGVTGFTTTTDFFTGEWQPGGDGATVGVVVEGEGALSCPADIDGDGELTLFDFLEFQNLFAAMDPRADFDGDGDLTLFDFIEFQNAFAQGCE